MTVLSGGNSTEQLPYLNPKPLDLDFAELPSYNMQAILLTSSGCLPYYAAAIFGFKVYGATKEPRTSASIFQTPQSAIHKPQTHICCTFESPSGIVDNRKFSMDFPSQPSASRKRSPRRKSRNSDKTSSPWYKSKGPVLFKGSKRYTRVYKHIHICVCVSAHTCIQIIYRYMYIQVCIYIYLCICIHTYLYTHT